MKNPEMMPDKDFREIAYLSMKLADNPVMLLDESGEIIWFNKAVSKILGYSGDELDAMMIWEIYDNITVDSWPEFWNGIGRESVSETITTHTKKNGENIDILLRTWKIDHDNRTILISYSHEITDILKAWKTLSQSEERYATFVNNYQGIAYIGGLDWIPRFFKGDVEGITGYTEEEIMDGKIAWNTVIHPDDLKWMKESDRELKQYPNTKKRGEYRIIRKDGTVRWVRDTLQNVCDEKGNPNLLVGSITDITDRKLAEDALYEANKKLNMLTSVIRHDILNYLMACQSYIHLMEMKTQDETMVGFLQNMEISANSIGKLIQFTKEYQNLGVEEPTWQNIKYVVEELKIEPIFRNVNIVNTSEPVEVYADSLLHRAFFNIFENSLRHGEKVSRIAISSCEKDRQYVIVIEDDGIGITDEDKKKIFNEHFGKHTGLGLFFVREILSITGISVSETGTPGKGARFEIMVPEGHWRKA